MSKYQGYLVFDILFMYVKDSPPWMPAQIAGELNAPSQNTTFA